MNQQPKPSGRAAKRISFYAINRRKALGRSVINQIRSVMPATPLGPMPALFIHDEWSRSFSENK